MTGCSGRRPRCRVFSPAWTPRSSARSAPPPGWSGSPVCSGRAASSSTRTASAATPAACTGSDRRLAGRFQPMPSPAFVDRLNEQVGHEYAAHQQYVAIAVHYDAETLPQLARFFYRQALEERDHAMMMVQYLLDADEPAQIPGVVAPQVEFADVVAPVALALDQERRGSDQ